MVRTGQERDRMRASKVERRAKSSRGKRRGRPPKFGRPSRLVALTLPDDVLASLRTLHPDLAWAVVQLVESRFSDKNVARQSSAPAAIAELVHLPGKRGLIVVQTSAFRRLQGMSLIPLADGRAFLAFDEPAGLADLEVRILDKLERLPTSGTERARLAEILDTVRRWRRDRGLVFRT